MGSKRVVKYRGLADVVEAVLRDRSALAFDGERMARMIAGMGPSWHGVTDRQCTAAMRFLAANGRARKVSWGRYQSASAPVQVQPAGPAVALGDEQIIDALLTAMAGAEPVLQRYKRLIKAVRGEA